MKHFILMLTCLFVAAPPSAAQDQREILPAATHAANIAKSCPGTWEKEACLHAVSNSAHDMVVNYAAALESAGKTSALETLKQVCAAATATESNIPAYAYTSAYTECANGIYDLSEHTRVQPDQSHYQLLITAVLCLSKDQRCAALELQMR